MKKLLSLLGNRMDLAIMAGWIEEGASVLDLGCGNGELLDYLIHSKKVSGMGIDIDMKRVISCIEKGIPVVEDDLNNFSIKLPDHSYDYVILSQTIQEVNHPDRVIDEILRIGRHGIVSFPNFGHIAVRSGLFFTGRMPKSKALPYEWYETPNIHMMTYADFGDFCRKKGIKILKTLHLVGNRISRNPLFPNLFTEGSVVLITSDAAK